YTTGSFRVTRGGSHGTHIYYLRTANRMGAVPQTRNWITGFRVVLGESPPNAKLLTPPLLRYQKNVIPRTKEQISQGPNPDKPYFKGPRRFVNIPVDMSGPVFASHNHNTSIIECPNGDLLASWFSTVSEGGREMIQSCSRLRWGAERWDQASQLWDAPDRNDSGHGLWHDGNGTIYHFANPSFAAVSMAILSVRESKDNGVTWSVPRVALPDFSRGQAPANKIFRMNDGTVAMPTDLKGTMLLSGDETLTWTRTSGGVAGIHAPIIELDDGRLMAFGRGGNIDGMMPMSISGDRGKSWTYAASEFPPIGGKQKALLLRLRQGPLFFASFADLGTDIVDESGTKRKVRGLFAAASDDEGKTWTNKRLITDDGPPHPVETTAGGLCVMSSRNSEFRGYMSCIQATNNLIHLITSRQHYVFNLKWLSTPQPAPTAPPLAVRNEIETFKGPDFDLDGWAHYHCYRGEFNDKGQYTIEALSPVSGLNRVVGKGSFDMSFAINNIRFGPSIRENSPTFSLWLKDDRVRTLVLSMGARGLGFGLKDREADKAYEPNSEHKVEFESPPKSAKFRLVYNEDSRRMRVYYGIDGAEPNTETPQSSAGIYFSRPLTESTVVYLLFSNGRMDIDHYKIEPIVP
ncbi:MAG: exo-alpha-sialidase, partial [Planctomycetota bacterium]